MLVKDGMTTYVLTVSPETNLEEAYDLLEKHGIRRFPVVGQEGTLIGVVSISDIKMVLVPLWRGRPLPSPLKQGRLKPKSSKKSGKNGQEIEYHLPSELTVADVMTEEVFTIHPFQNVAEAARLIHRHKIGGLPVVDEQGKVVGVITAMDLFEIFIKVMGISRAANRIDVDLKDDPEGLNRALGIVRDCDGRIISVIMGGAENGNVHSFELEPCDLNPVIEALGEAGYSVVGTAGTRYLYGVNF